MKRNVTTKILKVLAVTFSVLTMTACGSNETSSDSTTSTSTTTDAAVTTDTVKTLAEYDKVDSFNYFNSSAGLDDDAFNALEQSTIIKEYTGYDVTYTQQPAGDDADTAIQNAFMLKQDYQAVKVNKTQFYTLLASGALLPITEYVNASENLKDVISDVGWGTASQDGEIYGIPQKNAFAVNNYALAYRLDWLLEYNENNPSDEIRIPSEENGYSMTVSDFKKMLLYFATKVENGGKAFTIDVNDIAISAILPAFGIYQEWAEVNGSVEYIVNQPGFEEFILYMEDLYDEGLIAYQATSAETGAVASMVARNTGVAKVAHWQALAVESASAAEGEDTSTMTDDDISYIAALVPDDADSAEDVRVYGVGGWTYYTVIPRTATAEQAASVVDFADKKLDVDFFKFLVLGTEGETFEMIGDQYYPILPNFNDELGYSDKFMDGVREDDYAAYWLCRTRKTAAQDKMFSIANYNISNTAIESPTTLMPPNDVYDNAITATSTEVTNYLITWTYQTGRTGSIEEVQNVFNSFKGEEITAAVNEWYSMWEQKDSFNSVRPR
ncbi:MAG: hypothetical protein R3Y54_07025 [Eubacteriales bacterium]